MSCVSSSFSLPPKALSIDVDKRPRDLLPTVHFNSFFSTMLPSTFVIFLDTNTSSSGLGFLPTSIAMNFCHSSRRSGPRYVPAVGYALISPAVGPLFSCLLLAMLFFLPAALLPAVGPLFYHLFHEHPSVDVLGFTLSRVRSPASLFCECVSLAPRAPYTPSFAVWCLGLSRACAVLLRSSWHSMGRLRSSWHSMSRSPWHSMVFQRRCPRADPRVLFRTLLHVLRVWRALTSGWS